MESSLQHKDQRPEPAGFPLRPLVLSLALHAGVLAWWLPPVFDGTFSPPLATVLRGELLPVQPRTADDVPHAGHFIPPAPTFSRVVMPESATHPRPVAAPTSVPTPFPTALPQDAGGVAILRETPAPVGVALAADVAESGPDPAGLRQFRLALAGEARRFRNYPEAARRAGLVGTAEVRVAVAADGLSRHADLAQSSGHAMLDTAALEMLQQAVNRAVLPESLRGQSVAVLLPVVFEVAE